MLIGPGVPEGAEQDIVYGNIRIIIGVDALCMVNGMRFRPLYDIAKPPGGFNIGVLEYGEKGISQNDERGSFRAKTGDNNQAQTAQEGKANHIHRAEIKSPETVHSLCTVVHLVKYFP